VIFDCLFSHVVIHLLPYQRLDYVVFCQIAHNFERRLSRKTVSGKAVIRDSITFVAKVPTADTYGFGTRGGYRHIVDTEELPLVGDITTRSEFFFTQIGEIYPVWVMGKPIEHDACQVEVVKMAHCGFIS
jgi:hypothetical protein